MQAYQSSFTLAEQHDLNSIAYPNISTGAYRFPKPEAADIALNTLIPLLQYSETIQEVVLVCFDQENFELYQRLLSARDLAQSGIELLVEA